MQARLELTSSDPKVPHLINIYSNKLDEETKWIELENIGITKQECEFSINASPWDSAIVFAKLVKQKNNVVVIEFDFSSAITEDEYLLFLKKISKYISGRFNVAVWDESDYEVADHYTFVDGGGDPVNEKTSIIEPDVELLKGKVFYYLPVEGDDADDVLSQLIVDSGGTLTQEVSGDLEAVIKNSKTPKSVLEYAKKNNVKVLINEEYAVELVRALGGQALIDQFTSNVFVDGLKWIWRFSKTVLRILIYIIVAVVVFRIVFSYVTNR
jgi:hypothetical protein